MRRISKRKVARIGILGGTLFFTLLQNSQGLDFAWNRNPEADVIEYRIHYGVASRVYTHIVSAGNATNATIENLIPGITYYFALTALNTLGVESAYSAELSYLVPATLAYMRMRLTPVRHAVLTVTGPAGRSYNIQTTADFSTWTTIGTVTISGSGTSTFTDTGAAPRSRRFYRARAL